MRLRVCRGGGPASTARFAGKFFKQLDNIRDNQKADVEMHPLQLAWVHGPTASCYKLWQVRVTRFFSSSHAAFHRDNQ